MPLADLAADAAAQEAADLTPGRAVGAADQFEAVAVVHAEDFMRGRDEVSAAPARCAQCRLG